MYATPMPSAEKRIRAYVPVRVPFDQRVAAERIFTIDPRRWRSPTHVLRWAAEHGLPFVRALDVGIAHATRRKRGNSHVIGFWPETAARAREATHLGGAVTVRIIAAIDQGLRLGALIPPPVPVFGAVMPPINAAAGGRIVPRDLVLGPHERCSQCRLRKSMCARCRAAGRTSVE